MRAPTGGKRFSQREKKSFNQRGKKLHPGASMAAAMKFFCYSRDHVLLRPTLKIIATASAVFYDLHGELQAAREVVIPLIDSNATIVAT